QAGMKENLRIFHQDQSRDPLLVLKIRLQKRQKIDTPHALAKSGNRLCFSRSSGIEIRVHLKKPVRITCQLIADGSRHSAVIAEILVDPAGKSVQIQLIKLIFQQLLRLKSIQLRRRLLRDQANAGETVAAFL